MMSERKKKKKETDNKYIGRVYGLLTVRELKKRTATGRVYICDCECGRTHEAEITNLRGGRVKSCGCMRSAWISAGVRTHGDRQTRLYSIWTNMKTRCYNSNAPIYKHYGERGIEICDEWRKDFVPFRDWALENGYKENLSIDRIDNNGNYEPSNCRWADRTTQARNKSLSWIIEIEGERRAAKEWCDIFGVSYKTAYTRKSRGWEDIDAVSTPAQKVPPQFRKEEKQREVSEE